MNISRDQWLARSTVAACVASRWVSCASLGVTVLALCCLFFLKTPPMAEFAIAISAATGAAQAYLAARVEFERVIFEGIASATDAGRRGALGRRRGYLLAGSMAATRALPCVTAWNVGDGLPR